MKINLIHDDSIKTFADVTPYVELEDERLAAAKSQGHTFVAKSSSRKVSDLSIRRNGPKVGKRREKKTRQWPKRTNSNATRRVNSLEKRKMSKLKCSNCQVMGHCLGMP